MQQNNIHDNKTKITTYDFNLYKVHFSKKIWTCTKIKKDNSLFMVFKCSKKWINYAS